MSGSHSSECDVREL